MNRINSATIIPENQQLSVCKEHKSSHSKTEMSKIVQNRKLKIPEYEKEWKQNSRLKSKSHSSEKSDILILNASKKLLCLKKIKAGISNIIGIQINVKTDK